MSDSPDSPAGRRVLALIPAYNEGARVAAVIDGARAFLPVLVVDDGSTDDTAAHAESAGADVLHQRPNQGKGAALRAGFRRALDEGYDAVITLDADNQHDPAEIPGFLAAYAARTPDLIIGERTFRQMPFPRNVSNTIGRWLFSWALGQRVNDNQSGYRLISRRLMEATLASREQGFEFEVEMIVICVRRGYGLEGIPIRTIYGDETSHIKPFQQTVHFFRVVWQTWRAMHRSPRRRLIVPVLVVIALLAALLVAQADSGDPDDSQAANPFTAYPTPAPVTFIPPTPLPVTPQPTEITPVGQPAPDVSLPTLDGGTFHLADYAGQIVFLNFWATWCTPCQDEMPLLQNVHETHSGAGIAVITITDPTDGQDEDGIRGFIQDFALTLPVALSTDPAFFQAWAVAQIPTTYVIDRDGLVRFRHVGELHDHDVATYLDLLGDSG